MSLILASSSPRRADVMRAAGFHFTILPAAVDECVREGERPADYVQRLAIDKAKAIALGHNDSWIIGADTTVVVGQRMLGKPQGDRDAAAMLRMLAGTSHEVLTGVAICHGPRQTADVACTTVHFSPLSEAEIDWYVGTGEPSGKAGAYAIQGAAARFVERIEGSYSNVVGLPVSVVYRLLRTLEFPLDGSAAAVALSTTGD